MLFFLTLWMCWAQKLPEEKEVEVVDLTQVREVLQKDGLKKELEKKQDRLKKIEEERTKMEKGKFLYPSKQDYWSFAHEYWLVKNATWLKWDVVRPDYGIDQGVVDLFRQIGFVGVSFQILIVDSPELPHFSLPMSQGTLFLISLPFIKALDLSKAEIALLLLESYLRIQEQYLFTHLSTEEVQKKWGESFVDQKADLKWFKDYQQSLSRFIKEDGYSFQQQFELTKKIDLLLRPRPELWNAYVKMLAKIDRLIKSDALYRSYARLYPSPELQIKWLNPKQKTP